MSKKNTATAKKTAARKSVSAPAALPIIRVHINAAHANFYDAAGNHLDRVRNGAPGSTDGDALAAKLHELRKTHTVEENVL